jgi:hypothetical protein
MLIDNHALSQMWSKLLPRLVADGVGERNLDPDYANAEGSHIFGITDFFLCPRGLGSMTCVVLSVPSSRCLIAFTAGSSVHIRGAVG